MTKKVGKARGNRRRQAAKDLTAARSKDVKGGEVKYSEFSIKKLSDKASTSF